MKSKDIKLTPPSYALLALLDRFGELTSYEIKDALETSVENFWPVPHTTAYQEPARLASGGYLSSRQEKSGRRRRRYALTDVGREALREWADEPAPPPAAAARRAAPQNLRRRRSGAADRRADRVEQAQGGGTRRPAGGGEDGAGLGGSGTHRPWRRHLLPQDE